MAIIWNNMPCICGQPIDIDGPYFATTALGDPDGDGLLPLSDCAVHWPCLYTYREFEHFISVVENWYEQGVCLFEDTFVWVGLDTVNDEVVVVYRGTGFRLLFDRKEWSRVLTNQESFQPLSLMPDWAAQRIRHETTRLIATISRIRPHP